MIYVERDLCTYIGTSILIVTHLYLLWHKVAQVSLALLIRNLRMALQRRTHTRTRCQSAFAKSLYRSQIAYFQLQDAAQPIYCSSRCEGTGQSPPPCQFARGWNVSEIELQQVRAVRIAQPACSEREKLQ